MNLSHFESIKKQENDNHKIQSLLLEVKKTINIRQIQENQKYSNPEARWWVHEMFVVLLCFLMLYILHRSQILHIMIKISLNHFMEEVIWLEMFVDLGDCPTFQDMNCPIWYNGETGSSLKECA